MRAPALAVLLTLAAPAPAALAARGDLVTVGPGTLGTSQRQSAITPSGGAVVYVESGGVARVKNLVTGTVTQVATGVAEASISADGSRVAYSTTANAVVVKTVGAAQGTTIGSCASQPSISADGTAVACVSGADPVYPQVYLYREGAGAQRITQTGGGVPGDGASSRPALSADGRTVAYSSAASNISQDDPDSGTDAYVYDATTGTTEVVSRSSYETDPAGGGSALVGGISESGARVAFQSSGTSLGDGVFVFDRAANVLLTAATGAASAPAISPDGGYVAYLQSGVQLRELASATVIAAGGSGQRPSVARAGRFVVFDDGGQVLRRETREPPAIVQRPAISGTAREGETLSCSTGQWSGAPTSYAFAWLVDGLPAAGATGATHVVDSSEVGRDVRCRVTATNQDGSVPETSDGVRPEARPAAPLTPVVPVVTATPTPGPALEPSLTASVAPKREKRAPYRFRLRGALSADVCEGSVTVVVRRGTKKIATKRRAVGDDCAFGGMFSFTRRQLGRRGTLSFSVSHPGARTIRRTVRFG